jgi:hypothetical protein
VRRHADGAARLCGSTIAQCFAPLLVVISRAHLERTGDRVYLRVSGEPSTEQTLAARVFMLPPWSQLMTSP